MKAAPEGVAMVKKNETPTANTAFSAITKKIDGELRDSSHPRITKLGDKSVEILYSAALTDSDEISVSNDSLAGLEKLSFVPGAARPVATISIGFDSTENLQKFIEKRFSAETGAWKRIARIANDAVSDRWIKNSPGAISFLEMIQAIAERAIGGTSDEEVLKPLSDFLKSDQAKRNAQSKNVAPRTWVLLEWISRPDKEQGKAAFSRQYAQLVKKRFGVSVNPDTIARAWLTKREKKPTE